MNENTDMQLVLINAEDEGALFLPVEEVRKRYTAAQAEKITWKREAILMLLASDWPLERIASGLHVNFRTVATLSKQHAEKVAGFKKEFAQILMQTGARWIGLARTKEDGASFKDLMIGAGIAMQHARELHMMGEVGEEKVLKCDEDRAAAAAALRRIMANVESGPGSAQARAIDVSPSDSQSGAQALNDRCLADSGAGGGAVAGSDRRLDQAGGAQDPAAERSAAGAGGGSAGPDGPEVPDGSAKPGFVDKGSNVDRASSSEGSP